mgnify:CR=1 FL=1
MKVSSLFRSQQTPTRRNKIIAIVAVIAIAIAGYAIVVTRASGFFASVSPANATLSGNAKFVTESDGTQVLQFTAPVVTPPPTTPPISGWPSASTVGLKVATTRTLDGAAIDDAAWFKENGFPGSGTQSDPWVVDRILFKDVVNMGRNKGAGLEGKWVKFTNCRFYGNPGNPTPSGSSALTASFYAPFFIIEDSTIGPNLPLLSTGGTSAGTNFGTMSWVPFQMRRTNVFGANILVGFETERSDTTGVLVEDNYLHDIFSAGGDHTDIINGNGHASHVVIRHNYLDGIRSGNSYVANGIGIYNDNINVCDKCATIENWTVEKNYFDRANRMILAPDSTSLFLNPFIIRDNTFTNRYSTAEGGIYAGRTPSLQSGNVDASGKALQL